MARILIGFLIVTKTKRKLEKENHQTNKTVLLTFFRLLLGSPFKKAAAVAVCELSRSLFYAKSHLFDPN